MAWSGVTCALTIIVSNGRLFKKVPDMVIYVAVGDRLEIASLFFGRVQD